ncbi:MAG: substrate-binding domain-containing protein [bacterium]|jgi:molybdate transport system substrate-binding protein|nr:substrate-binding domain-containing protein [Betaproteobacteria bacterium]
MKQAPRTAVTLRLISAGGFKAAMEALVQRFEADTGYRSTVVVGTPADTRRLMGGGTPFDVAVVTSHTLTDAVAASIDPATRFSIARSPAGMGVRETLDAPAIVSEASFRAAIYAVGSIALSDPRAGTNMANVILDAVAGIGLRPAIEAKARYLMGPGFVVARRVADGEADAVMTLATEIRAVPGIRYLGALPESLGIGTVFDAAIANAAGDIEAAQAFIAFLRTPEAGALMRATGLATL